MIEKVQAERAFYFSYDLDLTKNFQTQLDEIQQSKLDAKKAMYPNSIGNVPQFTVNHEMLKQFDPNCEYDALRVPCIFGYVHVSKPTIKHDMITEFGLIGRKDYRRPGRRFMTRGLDRDGNAANFVETEHVLTSRPQNETQGSRLTLSCYV
jgi:hypothetical protein